MAALEFTEIPSAQSGPDRDRFELFAREFLIAEGFRIVEQPDRGADGGRDIIVEEDRLGPGGANVVRWLVSCKHKAHSGTSVTPADEPNVRDRLGTHRCHGFVAFYSTLPSSGLGQTLSALWPTLEYLQLDSDVIERKLLESPLGRVLAARYMPRSFNRWIQASHAAALPLPVPFLPAPWTPLRRAPVLSDQPGRSAFPQSGSGCSEDTCTYCRNRQNWPQPPGTLARRSSA